MNINDLFKKSKKVKLTEGEFNKAKENLFLFMKENPVRPGSENRHLSYRSNPVYSLYKLNLSFKTMPILLILALFVGGGASLAAENAVPGDLLYPVKVSVNEKVGGWVRVGDEAEAKWNVKLAEKRLVEAEELASDGELDADVRIRLENNFQRHADKVESRIAALSDADAKAAADIVSSLRTSLNVHDRILMNIGTSLDGQVEKEIKPFLDRVRKENRDAEKTQLSEEREAVARADVESAAQGRMKAAENKIAEVEKYINSKSDELGTDGTAQAKVRLESAKTFLNQGKVKLEAKAYAEAFVLFGKAHAVAQEAKLLIRAKIHFEDKIVPTPTASVSPAVTPSGSPGVSPSPTPTPTPTSTPEISDYDNDDDDSIKPMMQGRVKIDMRL